MGSRRQEKMDSLPVNTDMVKALEQAIDQIVTQELASNKPDPAKTAARQKVLDFNLELSRISGEAEQAQKMMAAADAQESPQAQQKYVYWRNQLELLESQTPLPPGVSVDFQPPSSPVQP